VLNVLRIINLSRLFLAMALHAYHADYVSMVKQIFDLAQLKNKELK